MKFRLDTLEIRSEQPRRQTIQPFIKVPRDDSPPLQTRIVENVIREQLVHLLPSFEVRCAHVQIHEMDRHRAFYREFRSQAAAGFPLADSYVVVLKRCDR